MRVRGQISIKILLILRLEPWPMLEDWASCDLTSIHNYCEASLCSLFTDKTIGKKKVIFTPVSPLKDHTQCILVECGPLNLLKHRYNSFVSSHQVSAQLHFKAKRFFRRWFNFRVCFLTILTRSFQGSRDRR